MSDNDGTVHPAVSFAAAEDPNESVAHETAAIAAVEAADHSPVADADADNDTPPEEPVTTSLLGGGPVAGGGDLTI
jgi:hypothetical protein